MKIINRLDREIIHFSQDHILITSKYRTVYYQNENKLKKISLPEKNLLSNFFGHFRLSRRLLRLDKCNVFFHKGDLIIIRQGKVYLYVQEKDSLTETLKLRNCRNILHQSMSSTPDGLIYFGEYGANKARLSVPIYQSSDNGKSWIEVFSFPPGRIRHVHGCYYDKFSDKVWVCTGDFENENLLLVADREFKETIQIGDGQQRYRTCNLIFKETKVHWLMDSPLENSYHIVFDRSSETIEIGQKLMGPVIYIKELSDGTCLAATSQEIGPGVLDDKIYLYSSQDLKTWECIRKFEHDGLPKGYFKFGVIGFADGRQSRDSFYMFFEAIKEFDGQSVKCSLA